MLRRRQQLHGDVRGSVLCNYLRAGRSDPCPKHERPNHLWSDLCPNHGAYHNQPYSVAKPSA